MKINIIGKNLLFLGLICFSMILMIVLITKMGWAGVIIDIFFSLCFLGYYIAGRDSGKSIIQEIEIGQVYKYYGCNKEDKILFLSVHIHEDVPIDLNLENSTLATQAAQTETIDYNQCGMYYGILFEDINPEDLVEGHIESEQLGIIKKR